jgi:hypothetical protein
MARFIEVPLPDGAQASQLDMEMLKATLQAIVAMRFEYSEKSVKAVEALETSGWQVKLGPAWVATGRSDQGCEQVIGQTPDEAIGRLYEELRLRHESGFGTP